MITALAWLSIAWAVSQVAAFIALVKLGGCRWSDADPLKTLFYVVLPPILGASYLLWGF